MKNALDNTKRSVVNQKLNKVLVNIYFNMFSSESIFKPIESEEQEVKKYEEAHFRALAHYINEQGFTGMNL
ncbi:hypothetical protein [Peribacillus butanolivorans]|uniref:hypothetical protein n=1 Tax=Peribacillus butanolivorans TaxID=421767 RepID=UPI0035D824B1